MKIKAMLLAAALFASACTTENQYGACHGVFDADEKRPELEYRVKKMNVALAVIFGASGLVPILTAGFWLWCPTGKKQ